MHGLAGDGMKNTMDSLPNMDYEEEEEEYEQQQLDDSMPQQPHVPSPTQSLLPDIATSLPGLVSPSPPMPPTTPITAPAVVPPPAAAAAAAMSETALPASSNSTHRSTTPRSEDGFIVVNDDHDAAAEMTQTTPEAIAAALSASQSGATDRVASEEGSPELAPVVTPALSETSATVLTPRERQALAAWHDTCRQEERIKRMEWRESASNGRILETLTSSGSSTSAAHDPLWWTSSATTAGNTATGDATASISWNEHSHHTLADQDDRHSLAILDGLPQQILGSRVFPKPVGRLDPGTTVVATKLITLDTESFTLINVQPQNDRHESDDLVYPPGRPGWIQMLKIETETTSSTTASTSTTQQPKPRYVVLSINGYYFLGPGVPALYLDPKVWLWRVTCPAGAVVRQGLDLSTSQIATIPYGSLIRVHKKVVSAMGLSRLSISAFCERGTLHSTTGGGNHPSHRPHEQQHKKTRFPGVSSSSSTSTTSIDFDENGSSSVGGDWIKIEGWCSEFLNPLSGQRGLIVQPVPFPVPGRYRVCLSDGAVIRSGVELSSPQIGKAPYGALLRLTGRMFSEFPTDQCVERLQLAGNGGWISCRLNRPPPEDAMLVELVDTDHSFDPSHPGVYHLHALKRVYYEKKNHQPDDNDGREASLTFLPSPSSSSPSSSSPQRLDRAAVTDGDDTNISSSIGQCQSRMDDDDDDDDNEPPPMLLTTRSESFYNASSSSPSSRRRRQRRQHGHSRSCHDIGSSCLGSSGGSGGGGGGSGTSDHLFRSSGSGSGSSSSGGDHSKEAKCLICLCEDRTATLVHGETGHIACCLVCARILKAKKDPCPVCRMPIDLVIQHFWA